MKKLWQKIDTMDLKETIWNASSFCGEQIKETSSKNKSKKTTQPEML